MTLLQRANELAAAGFHVFPIVPGTKIPAIKEYPDLATRDPEQIRLWWKDRPYNIGISTSRYGEDQALLAVDIDTKNGKRGDLEVLRLELEEGRDFPPTYQQRTPSGGSHLIYCVPTAVKQGESVLARGLDVRSKGGYVVGLGSTVDGQLYTGTDLVVTPAPRWMIDACGPAPTHAPSAPVDPRIDQEWAAARATEYLIHAAPIALQGDGGDSTTYLVACRVKDQGVDEDACFDLLLKHWNSRCEPPWQPEELQRKVQNAYAYGQESPGTAAPEMQFTELPDEERPQSPIESLNSEYAFVTVGGGAHILWETMDPDGNFRLEHLGIEAFHQKLAARNVTCGDGKNYKLSRMWMSSEGRRSYDGICFRPQIPCPPNFYNLWRGFAVEPFSPGEDASSEAFRSLEMWLQHAQDNVCRGDAPLFEWLIGFFAHLVQRPWEKPHVALVLRGAKGVGKNALVERVGRLVKDNFWVASNSRYLVGNFNSHLENTLLFVLDEAIWAGNKQAEGILKDLVTGRHHLIEHKGKDPYRVENCTRVILIGNEEWIVPASQDERRFAVFDVGDGRKQEGSFFKTMQAGMEAGGYRLLLRYLLDFDLSQTDLNTAPRTAALLDQKIATLDPFHEWWRECLDQARVVGSDFGAEWKTVIPASLFRDAFSRAIRDRNVRSRLPTERAIGKLLKACLPSVRRVRKREGTDRHYEYELPPLDQCREEWEHWIGHKEAWEE